MFRVALFAFTACFLLSILPAQSLKLNVANLKSFKGNLMVYLWSKPNAYLSKKAADYLVVVDLDKAANKPSNGFVNIEIEGLNEPTYAFMLYHDENKSYNFERNFVGIPLEGFAFGNNAKPNLGAPKFQEAAINFNGKDVIQTVNVLY